MLEQQGTRFRQSTNLVRESDLCSSNRPIDKTILAQWMVLSEELVYFGKFCGKF